MKRLGMIIGLVLVLGLLVGSVSAQDSNTTEGDPMGRDGVSLAIYNQGTALVQDRRTFALACPVSFSHSLVLPCR